MWLMRLTWLMWLMRGPSCPGYWNLEMVSETFMIEGDSVTYVILYNYKLLSCTSLNLQGVKRQEPNLHQ